MGGKKLSPCICLSFALEHSSEANTQNPIASIITTCPIHLLKKPRLREGGSHGEGVGGSGVMLNQSLKIWLGPITMVRSQ
jgi:hypothetical protein